MNYRTLFIKTTGITGLLLLSHLSNAATCSIQSSVRNFSASVSTSISIPRNATIGPIGSEILITNGGSSINVTCTGRGETINYMNMLLSPGALTSTAGVYQTNVPGIGFKIRSASIVTGTKITILDNPTFMTSTTIDSSGTRSVSMNIANVYLQFYVTGLVSPGNVTFSAPTLAGLVGPTRGSEIGAVTYSNLTITGSVPVTILACETPDIIVNLKKHNRGDFPSVGSTSSTTSFNFVIKDCAKNLNSVHYTFKPASGITLQGSGTGQYLTLDNSSTANGVGVQVLYENGTNVPFNTKTKYTGYSKSIGGNYIIPMKARYIRTGTISPGTANSAVEFDMTYE